MNSITKIAILLIFSGIIPVNAQVRNKKATNKLYDTDNKIVTNYVDSLTQFRNKQDSTYKKIGKESKTYNTLSTFAPLLFLPLIIEKSPTIRLVLIAITIQTIY